MQTCFKNSLLFFFFSPGIKDETQTYINKLKRITNKLKIISLTKTKYKF